DARAKPSGGARRDDMAPKRVTSDEIARRVDASGLASRGVARAGGGADLPHGVATLALVGFAGARGWGAFAASPEAHDGAPDPLDRWSRRVIGALADALGARAFFPFGGPPHWPFQRWALAAGGVHPSPLGLLIDDVFGLWHSYRGALGFADAIAAPAARASRSPCEDCRGRPCLSACPVGAFTGEGFDAKACRSWLSGGQGGDCLTGGCLARRACPVGAEHRQGAEQAAFHLRAFARAGRGRTWPLASARRA
ncbi:MAG: hypothetical protein KGI57_06300, partial [Hyphomicrobiales bacterium]|nr:hypothetical protein [Hyphomicrobiales bacterium]